MAVAKWEYASVEVTRRRVESEFGLPPTVDWVWTLKFCGPDAQPKDIDGNHYILLNKLGADGWEVFDVETVTGDIFINGYYRLANTWLEKTFWLKRQLEA